MIHRKYSLFFILTLLFAQSAHAAGSSMSVLEESCCTTFSTARINKSSGKKAVKQFNLNDYPNLQFNDVPSVGKGKEKAENRKPHLRDLLENWHQGLNSSQEQSTNYKALDYLRENKKPIAIFKDLMDSGFIISVSGNTALRLSNSDVYVVIPNPGEEERNEPKNTIKDAGLNLFERKEETFQGSQGLGKKTEAFFKNFFTPAMSPNKQHALKELGKKFYNPK